MPSCTSVSFKTRRKSSSMPPLLPFVLVLVSVSFISSVPLGCPEGCTCFFGFPASLKTASCEEIKWNGTFFPTIRSLEMKSRKPGMKCLVPEETSKMFPNLLSLHMTNCSLNKVQSDLFRNFKSLENVDLSHNQLTDLDAHIFKTNKNLKYVNLESNNLKQLRSPVLISSSLVELNLASCNLDKVPLNTFKELPSLRHLTLSQNNIRSVKDNTFPDRLTTLDLSHNSIVNVPTEELNRLSYLTQINLSDNPVNCTCALIGFQNWVSGKGVIFISRIRCAHPDPYVGHYLINIPQYSMCDAKVEEESTSAEQCSNNQICNNIVVEDGYAADQPTDDDGFLEQDQVFMAHQALNSDDSMLSDDGSGDPPTDVPDTPDRPTSSSSSSSISEPKSSDVAVTEATTNGVMKVSSELGSTSPTSSTGSLEQAVSPSTPSAPPQQTAPPVTSSETSFVEVTLTVIVPTSENPSSSPISSAEVELTSTDNNHTQLQQRLLNDSNTIVDRQLARFVIPGLAVLVVALICIAVFCVQFVNKKKKYKRSESGASSEDGSELQQVSLLADKSTTTVVNISSRYPNEKDNSQKERLMNGASTKEAISSNSRNSGDTVDYRQLPNDHCQNQNVPAANGNIECTVVKVTTIPDSVPRRPIIKNM